MNAEEEEESVGVVSLVQLDKALIGEVGTQSKVSSMVSPMMSYETVEEVRMRRRMGKSPVSSDAMQESSYNRKSNSSSSSVDNICFCGLSCPVQTSWTRKNPGRRFISYLHYTGEKRCGFFKWVDPVVSDRAREVIIELRDRLDQLLVSSPNLFLTVDDVGVPCGALAIELKVEQEKVAALIEAVKSDRKQLKLLTYCLLISWVLFFLFCFGIVVMTVNERRAGFGGGSLNRLY